MKNNHTDFILSPISKLLEDAVTASAGIDSGIEAYPLHDYIMQSLFLKMTGFQEQKMKCICWELATDDYEYRYNKFSKNKIGECSTYEEKNNIYKELIQQIKNHDTNFNISNNIDKNILSQNTINILDCIFTNTNLQKWAQSSYNTYEKISEIIKDENFGTNTDLFSDKTSLKNLYTNHLYKHRNRCAHNTLSYQQNLPTLKTLKNEDYKYENYFLWFFTLTLIDDIFISLYKIYLEKLASRI